jgi:hypothetical protein
MFRGIWDSVFDEDCHAMEMEVAQRPTSHASASVVTRGAVRKAAAANMESYNSLSLSFPT